MYKYLILLLSVFLVVSCTTSSSSNNASLSGTISLIDTDDHSGVTIALYNLAHLDTTLVRINQEYPHIGVIITQETEFDHRLQTPVKFTQTDIAGNFKLDGIRPGKYNLALLKEGYSLKYIYNLHLSEGSNTLPTDNKSHSNYPHINNITSDSNFVPLESFAVYPIKSDEIDAKQFNRVKNTQNTFSVLSVNSVVKNSSFTNNKTSNSNLVPLESFVVKNTLNPSSVSSVANIIYLYPSVVIPSVVSTPITFESGIQYNFPQNTIITAPVTIEPGTLLAVGVNRKIDFYSTISTPETGSRWWLTSSHSLNTLPAESFYTKKPFVPLESFVVKNSTLSDLYFDRLNILGTSQITLQNGKVSFIKDGINITPDNSIYQNIRAQYGFSHANVSSDNHTFSNVLVSDFTQRVHSFEGSSVIDKNIFYNNIENMLLSENEFLVLNNYFQSNYVALRPFYGTISIKNNNFNENDFGISTVASAPMIEFNNFYWSKTYCIQTHRYYNHGYEYSNPRVNNNNLYSSNKIISLIAIMNMYDGTGSLASGRLGMVNDLNATQNFWKSDPALHIVDNTVYPNEPVGTTYYCPYLIIYEPKRNTKIPNAGIL